MSTPTPPPTGPVPQGGMPGSASQPGPPHQRDVGEASVGELLGNVTRDLSTLMRQELALAQAELRQEATKTGKAAGALSGAGVAALLVALFVSLALWAALSNVMHAGWAALIVAVLWAIVAAVLYATGRAKLREVHPTPERTVETLSSVPDTLRGHRGGTTP